MGKLAMHFKITLIFMVNLILQGFLGPFIAFNALRGNSLSFANLIADLEKNWLLYLYFLVLSSPIIYGMVKNAAKGGKNGWVKVCIYILFLIFLCSTQFGIFFKNFISD